MSLFQTRASRPRTRHNLRACRLRFETLEDRRLLANLPPGFVETAVVEGLDSATAMALAPDGRVFVAEQQGALRVVKNGQVLQTPFVSLNVNPFGERGLVGVTLDPNFAANGYVYVYYTSAAGVPHNRISRFTALGDVAAPASELVIADLPAAGDLLMHNGGAMRFGPDGKLYVGVGDHGTGANSQSLESVFGKILRFNSDGSIPADNPFYAQTTGLNRAIWALGLRNPFSLDVQPGTGRIYINDVGQSTWEEINQGQAGGNYGWPAMEGPATGDAFLDPLFAYRQTSGEPQGCAITGGAFYNPAHQQFPAQYAGDYFFADYCGDWIWRYDPQSGTASEFASDLAGVFTVDLAVDAGGSLWYLDRGNGPDGKLYRIDYARAQTPPVITQQPLSQRVAAGQPAVLTVAATGTAPFAYQWKKNGANIAGATSATHAIAAASPADQAKYSVTVSNAYGAVTSAAVALTVVENAPPVPVITLPEPGASFGEGDVIAFAGFATDAEDGPLPASALTWEIRLIHDEHSHPFYPPTNGIAEGSIAIPPAVESHGSVFYRVYLTARDSTGFSATTHRDVVPRLVQQTVAPLLVVAPEYGQAPVVHVYDANTLDELYSVQPYATAFTGGVRVALGDVSGDGVPDLVTAAGRDGGPHIRVFDGRDGTPLPGPIGNFFAYLASFTGGVFVAAGDVNADGKADLVTGAGAAGGPHVRVFDAATGQVLYEFFAYPGTFQGGVHVAAADLTGDGKADVITAPGSGMAPQVRVFDAAHRRQLPEATFLAYASAFTGGVYVAAGDINGDGTADIITGAGPRGGPHVRVFDGVTRRQISAFFAFEGSVQSGVRVSAADLGGDGRDEVLATALRGNGPLLRVFDASTGTALLEFPRTTNTAIAAQTSRLDGIYAQLEELLAAGGSLGQTWLRSDAIDDALAAMGGLSLA